ncbi:MAG: glycine cleavage T C-terminal barrel domain-containing protein, partial [Cyanobacteria bacterium P01_H01_bin.121]
ILSVDCTSPEGAAAAATLWQTLAAQGAVPLGTQAWDYLRVLQGRPAPDQELTEAYNPLEAGLWHTISFDKGCYIGQEVIARLNTYKGVRQRLWGLKLTTAAVEPNTPIILEGNKIGTITSLQPTATGAIGLGYIRTRAGGPGLVAEVAGQSVEVTALDYAQHPEVEAQPAEDQAD